MPNKKKAFNKGNSEKFLLLRGNSQAVNADGKTLENILVPVSKNYKPGTSLLMSNIPALSNLEPDDIVVEEHEDVEGIFDDDDTSTVDYSDAAENVVENLLSDMKKLKFSRKQVKFDTFTDDDEEEEEDFDFHETEKIYHGNNTKNNSKKNDCQNIQNCSENLKMFNEKFEKVLEEYADSEIGSLDDDMDMLGMESAEPFHGDIEDYNKEREFVLEDCDEELKEKILHYADDSGDEKFVEVVTEKPLEFDCESILSTCSNIYNHPAVIKEERIGRIRRNSQMSDTESDSRINSKLLSNTCSNIRKKDETPEERKERLKKLSNIREKGETPEERKERQKKFKEIKKLKRELKKQTKEAFKEEKKLQTSKDQNHQNAAIKLL